MEASGGLSGALGQLTREIENSLTGNAYYMAAGRARELGDLLGADLGKSRSEAGIGVPAALRALGQRIEAELSGNRYFLASRKLDALGFYLLSNAPAESPPAETQPPRSVEVSSPQRSFDDLAAISLSRLKTVSESVGILVPSPSEEPRSEAPEPQEAETPEVVERRSSEPCDMPPVPPVPAASASDAPVSRPARQASADMSRAIGALTREIEQALTGNSYYMAAARAREIGDFLGADLSSEAKAGMGLPAALNALRKRIEAELSGNSYFLAARKLDALAFYLSPPPAAPAPAEIKAAVAPERETPVRPNGAGEARSFDDLAARSLSRLETVSGDKGISLEPSAAPEPSPASPPQYEVEADGELERRSIEPCGMRMPDFLDVEAVEAARIPSASTPQAEQPEAPDDLGSQDASAGPAEPDTRPEPRAATPEEAPQPASAAVSAASANASPAASTGQVRQETPAPAASPRPQQKEQKSLFMLWLDIIFGRKRGN